MLIIPFDRKLDWKNPPIITLLLLLANVLIFLFFQLDDDQQMAEAGELYKSSGLQEIELPHYKGHLQSLEEAGEFGVSKRLVDLELFPDSLMWMVQTDPEFLQGLQRGKFIKPSTEGYLDWYRNRQAFEEKYEAVTYIGHGLRTAKFSMETLISHMFLHGGVWHLVGNCIFLLAVGFLVELTLGRWVYLIGYLVAGFGSAAFDFLFNSGSLVPGIGASGAISGLMGMYAVLYGLRKVKFFYSIGIYFDYVSLPAIVLLPLWIGNEVVQILLYSDVSNINYLAHLGGLVTGAIVAFIVKQATPSFNVDFLDEEKEQKAFEEKLEEVRGYCDNMEYRKALSRLRGLYREDPKHREILCRYYECSRISPTSDEYHELARAIFKLTEVDSGTDALVLETYKEYLSLAKPGPRLNGEVVCRLAERLIRLREVKEADKLLRVIVKKRLACGVEQGLVFAYADLLEEQGQNGDAARYRQLGQQLASVNSP
ncbi:MAG: rhomboid family intramembrane serine protease [Chromatiales bacterium]|nr:rhomboid family intramembrane serine protease [Chromatiales bacterium]